MEPVITAVASLECLYCGTGSNEYTVMLLITVVCVYQRALSQSIAWFMHLAYANFCLICSNSSSITLPLPTHTHTHTHVGEMILRDDMRLQERQWGAAGSGWNTTWRS